MFLIINILSKNMDNIFDYSLKNLEDYLVNINEKKYIAQQIFKWIYQKKVFDFNKMSNLSLKLRQHFNDNFDAKLLKIKDKQTSKDTIKYLFELEDGNFIESVIMKHNYGISICISSQIGCNMGCKFCESGRLKKIRNLKTSEMVTQILTIENDLNENDNKNIYKISSVVVMGIGEPFDNYDNVLNFVKIINNKHGLNIGARHITISTSGIIKGIEKYSKEKIQINLAVSLHAPNDEIRNKIMPINKAYNIKNLIDSIKNYIKITNRKVGLEYVLLKDINDSRQCAEELVKLIKGMNVYVNLIEYNKTNNIDFESSSKQTMLEFYNILKKNNIDVTIRRKFGENIDGACGQLRSKNIKNNF